MRILKSPININCFLMLYFLSIAEYRLNIKKTYIVNSAVKGYLYMLISIVILFSSSMGYGQEKQSYKIEDLGQPVPYGIDIEFVTNSETKGAIAWAGFNTGSRAGLVGINTDTGKVTDVDFTPYGNNNGLILFKKDEKTIYIFGGQPGRFFRYDIETEKLSPLGTKTNARYWVKNSRAIAPDGKIYVGTYPDATVLVLDPSTDKVETIKQVSDDLKEEYVLSLAADKNGILYFGTGMHHAELWSYNPENKGKQQILPDSLQTYGHPPLKLGVDGKVYGQKGSVKFLSLEDKIVLDTIHDEKKEVLDNKIGTKTATKINKEGALELKDTVTDKITTVESDFPPPSRRLFSINSNLYNGRLYGSSIKPGSLFYFDTDSKKIKDLGIITRGKVQIYDFLSSKEGVLLSSYTGGYLDYYKPDRPLSTSNPRPVAALHKLANQERAVQLTTGPDNNIYLPTQPIKGYLGGTLVRVKPEDWNVKVYDSLIHNQSFTSVASIPQTEEIFVTSTVRGGTSSKPTEKEAWVFLWDPKSEEITYKTQPLNRAKTYSKAVLGSNEMVYGFSGGRYYVFDPKKRKTIFTGRLPKYKKEDNYRSPILSANSGSDGFLYGIDIEKGNLFSIDPKTYEISVLIQDDSMKNTRFAEAESDGYLYYENNEHLMRVKIEK